MSVRAMSVRAMSVRAMSVRAMSVRAMIVRAMIVRAINIRVGAVDVHAVGIRAVNGILPGPIPPRGWVSKDTLLGVDGLRSSSSRRMFGRAGGWASALTVLLALACAGGCTAPLGQDSPRLDFDRGEVQLALTDPELIAEAGSYLGAAYFADGDAKGCVELLRMTTAELAAYRVELVQADVALAATQAWPADPIANRADPFNPEPSTHTFGALRGWGKYAFVVLASRLVKHYESGDYPFGEAGAAADDLEFASGTVFAMGCTEAQVIPGERLDLRIVLYPAGMR